MTLPKLNLDTANVMTFAMITLALIIVVIGGVVVIMGNMTFADYLTQLQKFAVGVGLTAIGRGLAAFNSPKQPPAA